MVSSSLMRCYNSPGKDFHAKTVLGDLFLFTRTLVRLPTDSDNALLAVISILLIGFL